MKHGSQWIEELLILSGRAGESLSAWRPFSDGRTIDESVAWTNDLCRETVQENTPNQLVACADTVTPILKIRWARLSEIGGRDRFKLGRPSILLLDLDSLRDLADLPESIRQLVRQQKRFLHLLQVSESNEVSSLAPIFKSNNCVLPSQPEIFNKEEELEAFFNGFAQACGDAWHGIARNPYDAPCRNGMYAEPFVHPRHGHFIQPSSDSGEAIRRVFLAYRDAVPALVAQTRDVIMARGLTSPQGRNLGRGAAIQELLLALVAETVRRRPVYPVSVENIRFPLVQMPVEVPLELNDLREMKLVAVHLNPDKLSPSQMECEKLADLGLAKGAFAAVHCDQPALWEQLGSLSEIVSAERFSAELAGWHGEPGASDISLNEACFGVRIEESYSRGVAS